jgi:hypothetical protein
LLKYLAPVGGMVDARFGVLATWRHRGVPAGVRAGLPWAADNGAFTRRFEPDRFLAWLDEMRPFRATCLFVAAPDVYADAAATLAAFGGWAEQLAGWPLAYVAQDGQEDLDLPDPALWDVLFVGGSTAWKLSPAAVTVIRRAQVLGKRVHVGRVNYRQRYRYFRRLSECEGRNDEWTCDGTRTRFEGVARALGAWAAYMAEPAPAPDEHLHLYLPGRDRGRQLERDAVGAGGERAQRLPVRRPRPGHA